jgi:hypothetical protein
MIFIAFIEITVVLTPSRHEKVTRELWWQGIPPRCRSEVCLSYTSDIRIENDEIFIFVIGVEPLHRKLSLALKRLDN